MYQPFMNGQEEKELSKYYASTQGAVSQDGLGEAPDLEPPHVFLKDLQ